MHELSIAEALRQSLLEYHQQNGGKIVKLFVAVGRLGGIDPEALEYVWPMAMEETNDEIKDCKLEIECLDIEFRCESCGKSIYSTCWIGRCPHCESENLLRLSGRELIIKAIEVEN